MKRGVVIVIVVLFFTYIYGSFVYAQTTTTNNQPIDLKEKIKEKSKELREIQDKKEAVENNLNELNKSQRSLKREIRKIDVNIKQLDISVKTSVINIEKINLELKSIKNSIPEIEDDIKKKKNAIKKLLIEIQKKDQEGILSIIFKNKTLSQNVDEIQRMTNLGSSLVEGIHELGNLEKNLRNKTNEIKYKKRIKNNEKNNLINRKYIIQEKKLEKNQLLSITKNKESIYQAQMTELEKRQASISNEIEAIESILRKNIDINLLPVPRPLFLWPVLGGKITQGYGRTKFALRAYRGKYHNGIDIGAPIGTPIFSTEKGRVINVGNQDKFCWKGAYGKFVVVKHENGLTTLYGHMSRYTVRIGQEVQEGEVIGYVGQTGYATGPHLHLTVFASQTLTPAKPGFPEGSRPSRTCGPMPVGGDMNPLNYF